MRLGRLEQVLWASDRKLGRQVVSAFATPEYIVALGDGIDRDVRRLLGSEHNYPCHLAVYEKAVPVEIDEGHASADPRRVRRTAAGGG